MTTERTSDTELRMANINLLLRGTFEGYYSILAMPLEDVAEIAQLSGHNGLEVHAMSNTTRQGRDLQSDNLPSDVAEFIASGHQGFRRERNLVEVLQHPNKVYALGAYLLLPESAESLRHLADLQQAVGHDLPVVLYPYQYEKSRAFVEEKFGKRMFQPGRDFDDHTGTKTIDDVIEKLNELDALMCLDTDKFLEQRDYVGSRKDGFPGLEKAVEKVAESGLVAEIHLRLGAIDNSKSAIDTVEELRVFIGTNKAAIRATTTARLLTTIKNSGISVPVVNEVPADAIQIVLEQRIEKPKDLVSAYLAIAKNTKELLV